jgi:transcription elongation factor GreA
MSTTTAEAGAAHVGSTVTYTDPATGDCRTVQIVASHDADAGRGRLSMASPVGNALLGSRPSEVVRVMTPRGERRLQIDRVL